MNKIAVALFAVGWLCIIGGFGLGLANIEQPITDEVYPESVFSESVVEEAEPVTETSWATFFTYLGVGVVAGIMMFGFAEIVRLLDKNAMKEKEGIK